MSSGGIGSHYWWQGQIEHSAELLLIVKTVVGALAKLEEVVRTNHPYECPEILAMAVASGARGYLGWLREAVGS